MVITLSIGSVDGLPEREAARLQKLQETFNFHAAKNAVKDKYYEGKIPLSDVNLGIALPEGLAGLEIGCSWGSKTVDVLAARSMFDGFVASNGEPAYVLDDIVRGNRLVAEYAKACRDELEYGCTFATLSADPVLGCKIRFHSPRTAAAIWNGELGRIAYGLAIVELESRTQNGNELTEPRIVNYYDDSAIWVLTRDDGGLWSAERRPHLMGRPLMEPLIWNATSTKPFGRSRIKEPIRRLIEGFVRTVANATIGLEFSTSPQKYLLGVSDDVYDTLINQKFKQYVGSILAATTNPETGEKPTFGQLVQGSISPHVEMLRILATQFSAATGLSVTDTGVVSEANPTSADAVLAQTQTLVGLAEQLNVSNGDALRVIALMAQAIAGETTLDALDAGQLDVIAHFKNPALPSVAATTDAAVKIASVRQAFGQTDTFLEMIGFGPADIRRIKAQEQRARGAQLLEQSGIPGVTAGGDGETA